MPCSIVSIVNSEQVNADWQERFSDLHTKKITDNRGVWRVVVPLFSNKNLSSDNKL